MLSHSQIRTLLLVRHRILHQPNNMDDRTYSIFSQLPVDLIREISEYGQDPNSQFAKALHHVAYGELNEVKAVLEAAKAQPDKQALKTLLLSSGTVVTRSGQTISSKTLLECALGEGDPEMAAMIMPYFSKIALGEKEKERQIERYRPSIKKMKTQKPYHLAWLIDIIKESSDEDVKAALNKDMSHASKLRDALIQFRNDVRPKTVTQPQMHYNYHTLIHALKILQSEENHLKNGNNNDKFNLVWRQIIGYLQRGLPAVDRFAFARTFYELIIAHTPLERKTVYKYNHTGSFPNTSCNESDLSGLGYDYGIYGVACESDINYTSDHAIDALEWGFEKIISRKNKRLEELISHHLKRDQNRCVIA